jgi:hypothetical protein
MTTDEPVAHFTLVVDVPDADNDELKELTRHLQAMINDLPVETAEEHPVPPRPGSKAGVAMAINAVDVTARPGLLSDLINVMRRFVSFGEDRRVELTFQVGEGTIMFKGLAQDIPVIFKSLNEYQELRPQVKTPDGLVATLSAMPDPSASARSGGADIAAEELSVGGDVVGRDKIMSAGGHIIIAREGATVIVNDEYRASAEYQ